MQLWTGEGNRADKRKVLREVGIPPIPAPFETPEELKRVIEKIDQFNKKYNWISVEGCSDEDWLDFIIAYKQMELVFDNLVYIANHHGKFPKDYRP